MVCRTLRRCVPGATTDEVFHSTHAQVSVCKGGPVWGDKTWCVSVTSVTSHPVSTVCSSQNADAEIFNTAVSLCYAKVSPHAAAPEYNTAAGERDLFTLLANFGQHCIFVWFQAAAAFIPALFKDKTKQNISFGVTATISPLLPPAFPILQITSPSPTRSPLPIFCWCIRFKDPSAALVNVWLQTWPTRIIESCTILRPECACVSVSFTSGQNFGCVWRNSQLAINPHSVITQHDWTSFQSGEVFLIPAQLIPICIRLAAAYQTDAAHSSQQEKKRGGRQQGLAVRDLGGVNLYSAAVWMKRVKMKDGTRKNELTLGCRVKSPLWLQGKESESN